MAMAGLERATGAHCELPRATAKRWLPPSRSRARLVRRGASALRGPIAEENRLERFAFYPDPKGLGPKQIAAALKEKDAGVTAVDTLRQKASRFRGLRRSRRCSGGRTPIRPWRRRRARRSPVPMPRPLPANLAQISATVRDAWASKDGFAPLN